MNIWIEAVVKGIKKRGLLRTTRGALGVLTDCWFDIKYGTTTIGWVNLDDLTINSGNKCRGKNYKPTKVRDFKKLMHVLNFPKDSVFVDLGSGKGRLLLLAAEYGFKRVVGIEFSLELCEQAKRNISIYKEKVGIDADIELVEADIVDYEIKDDENVFFMFNPFDEVITSSVLKNITNSFDKKPRKIWLIYNHPDYSDLIEGQGAFVKAGEYTYGVSKFNVYVTN